MWLLYKGANYSTDNKYFKGISRLDELFERACYYQLFDTFVELGFTPIIDDNINFLNEANIYEKVVFEKNTFKITLYYQSLPINLTTIKKYTNNLRPDFIIEFDDLSYVILDAKYKKLNNIEKYDYENLALKYLHGIGPKEGGYLKAIALLILFPKSETHQIYHSKEEYSIIGNKTVYPFIGSLGLDFDNSDSGLKDVIKRILENKYIE